MKRSPLAPTTFPTLPVIPGVQLAAGNAGIRYKDRPDVLLAVMDAGTTVAGVFTKSLTASASVLACAANLKHQQGRVLIVNSGNSNAFTGKAGVASVERIVAAGAAITGCKKEEVYTASTGTIGLALQDKLITDLLPTLTLKDNIWADAAQAICTTDTFPKLVTRTAEIGGVKVTINGIAKGSGMIAPDMATMLAYAFTDAKIPRAALQQLLAETNALSFNAITVDGDTSTSDMALLFATGKANNPDADLGDFKRALGEVMTELAQLVVKDGEGASKFITVKVTGAENDTAAKKIAMSIANSPLVKTAIAGEDANWGRVVMAVGKAGERADRDKLCIKIGGVSVAKNGEADPAYKEEQIAEHMKGQYIEIATDVGIASGSATVWTCDLTHGYIEINGSYRT